jgi:hypothetical protein
MKGCARTCLLWLAGWAAAGSAFYSYFRGLGVYEPQIWWASVAGGLAVAMTVSYVIGIITFVKERGMLLGAMVGRPANDGDWIAVSGNIRSLDPLRAPLTGVPSVAYQYEMYQMVSSGKSSSKQVYYEGKGLAPSTIATKQGAIRLLAVPTLDVPVEKTDPRAAIANAERYVSETTFETSKTPKDQRTNMEKESADDDGMFRVDKKRSDDEVEIAQCQLEERHIKQGEMVCAFGLYSSARGGLIPHPNWAKQARLMRGDANTVAGQLRTRIIKYAFGVVICAGIAFGIVRLYEWHVRTHAATVMVDADAG